MFEHPTSLIYLSKLHFLSLKGHSSEILCFRFFLWVSPSQDFYSVFSKRFNRLCLPIFSSSSCLCAESMFVSKRFRKLLIEQRWCTTYHLCQVFILIKANKKLKSKSKIKTFMICNEHTVSPNPTSSFGKWETTLQIWHDSHVGSMFWVQQLICINIHYVTSYYCIL
jgi:hypothetical protein